MFIAIQKHQRNSLQQQLGFLCKLDDVGILHCYGQFTVSQMKTLNTLNCFLGMNISLLCISEVHQHLIHAGVAHTLSQIREEYWILQGRVEVKSVISKCSIRMS